MEAGDSKTPHAPVINTTRVVKRGGFRGGSVPPIHLGAKVSRAASVPPHRGFARPTPVIHTVASTSSHRAPSIGRLSFAAPSASVVAPSFASLSGYQPRPIARRASIAAPGGSTIRIWSVGGSSAPSSSSSLRGLTEVTKGAAVRPVYRPSAQAGFGRSTSSVRVGLPQAGVTRSVGGGGTASIGLSRPPSLYHRRASISSFGAGGDWDEDYGARPLRPPVKTTLQRSSYVGGGGSTGKAFVKPLDKYLSNNRFNIKANDFISGGGVRPVPVKTSDNDVHHSKKYDYEKQMEALLPLHEDSLAKLRARAQVAKDHLSRHKILLDRYLPLHLGPENAVVDEVESRYGELLARMPHLDKRQKSNKDKDEYVSVVPPYKPASATTKGPKLSYDIVNTPVSKSFTPKISETRKRARSVLCKIHGDPKYFDF